MPMRFNPPPGWPLPRNWTPPSGWTPDPSWPAPPHGWPFWVEETPVRRPFLSTDTRWIIGGGAALFLGSLLPFITYAPNLYGTFQINGGFRSGGTFFGLIIIGIGVAMWYQPAAGWLASKAKANVLAIVLLLLTGLMGLGYLGIAAAGAIGVQEPTDFGSTVTVNYSPNIGLVLSIVGCAAAGVGAIIALVQANSARRAS